MHFISLHNIYIVVQSQTLNTTVFVKQLYFEKKNIIYVTCNYSLKENTENYEFILVFLFLNQGIYISTMYMGINECVSN